MLGTCTHGEVPKIYHPGYLDQWHEQVRLPLPTPQDKVLVGPSADDIVSKAILQDNVERRKLSEADEEQGDAEIKPTILNMNEADIASTEYSDVHPAVQKEAEKAQIKKAEEEESSIPQDP